MPLVCPISQLRRVAFHPQVCIGRRPNSMTRTQHKGRALSSSLTPLFSLPPPSRAKKRNFSDVQNPTYVCVSMELLAPYEEHAALDPSPTLAPLFNHVPSTIVKSTLRKHVFEADILDVDLTTLKQGKGSALGKGMCLFICFT